MGVIGIVFAILPGELVRPSTFAPITSDHTHCFRKMRGFKSAGATAVSDCAGRKPEQASDIWACSYVARKITVVIRPLIAGTPYDTRKSPVEGHRRFGRYRFATQEISRVLVLSRRASPVSWCRWWGVGCVTGIQEGFSYSV